MSRGDAIIMQEKQKNKAEATQQEMHKYKTTEMNEMNSLSCCKENGNALPGGAHGSCVTVLRLVAKQKIHTL